MNMYGLQLIKTGRLLSVQTSTSTQEGDEFSSASSDPQFELSDWDHDCPPWLVYDRGVAEAAAACKNDDWYAKSDYRTPGNRFVGQCRVVQVDLAILVPA